MDEISLKKLKSEFTLFPLRFLAKDS